MSSDDREPLLALFSATRARTESLAAHLSPEDQQLQSMPDASPTKWHRAHTTWFFEAFLLGPAGVGAVDSRYAALFNSYYEAIGPRHPRPRRGMLSRPTADEVTEYRRRVDAAIRTWVTGARAEDFLRVRPILELGIAHEEQHQELILTDILHAFAENPLRPSFLHAAADAADAGGAREAREAGALRFVAFEGGLHAIGAAPSGSFAFDNEGPRHKVWLEPFELADRLVTVGELKAFQRERGYETPSLWLSEGFDFVRSHGVTAPLYYAHALEDGETRQFTLGGVRAVADDDPVTHVSYYEADALARFLGGRLPSEAEWEVAASKEAMHGSFLDDLRFVASRAPLAGRGLRQLFGDAWEWTRSSYEPYPGYAPPEGAIGEYNGKFMVNQYVLRGGSCLTPRRHVRATYRNFWPAPTRFQMTGVRVAREVAP